MADGTQVPEDKIQRTNIVLQCGILFDNIVENEIGLNKYRKLRERWAYFFTRLASK